MPKRPYSAVILSRVTSQKSEGPMVIYDQRHYGEGTTGNMSLAHECTNFPQIQELLQDFRRGMLDMKQVLHSGHAHILGAVVENLLVRMTMRPGFVHPCPGTRSVPTWTRLMVV